MFDITDEAIKMLARIRKDQIIIRNNGCFIPDIDVIHELCSKKLVSFANLRDNGSTQDGTTAQITRSGMAMLDEHKRLKKSIRRTWWQNVITHLIAFALGVLSMYIAYRMGWR